MLQDGFTAAFAEEHFVAHEDVGGPQLACFTSETKRSAWAKARIRSPPEYYETRVRANSRESRSNAGESSSKKLESSRETWYCSRNTYEGIFVENLALVVGQCHLHVDRDQSAGGAAGLGIIGQRRVVGGDHGTTQSRVGGILGVVNDMVMGAGDNLLNHRTGQVSARSCRSESD